jgi:hypothetical protein
MLMTKHFSCTSSEDELWVIPRNCGTAGMNTLVSYWCTGVADSVACLQNDQASNIECWE